MRPHATSTPHGIVRSTAEHDSCRGVFAGPRRHRCTEHIKANRLYRPTSRQTLLNEPLQEENHLKVLRLLAANPEMNQRDLADALGVSLGKTNYCLKALLGKGFIKMQSFRRSQQKLAYAYILTPVGIVEKAGLTARFLERKMAEYESLKLEIESLRFEVQEARPNHPLPHE